MKRRVTVVVWLVNGGVGGEQQLCTAVNMAVHASKMQANFVGGVWALPSSVFSHSTISW